MLTIKLYKETLKTVREVVNDEDFAKIKNHLKKQVLPYSVGDFITTPRGTFKITYIDDTFIETESEYNDVCHIFKTSDYLGI